MNRQSHSSNRKEYQFCPYDGSPLKRAGNEEDRLLPTCSRCGFTDYGNPKPCTAVLVEDQGRLLLTRRGVEPAEGMWDIPGGFVEAEETVEDTIRREILEETGLVVDHLEYYVSYPDVYGPENVPTLNLCFTAKCVGGAERPGSDVSAIEWFFPHELPENLAFAHQKRALAKWREQRHESSPQ